MAMETKNESIYISTNKITFFQRFREVYSYRTLIWTLAWRDIQVRYKQSLLGIVWAMFIPVSMTLLFSFVFTKIVTVKTDIPYPIFAYCGLLPWQFFSSATTSATNSLIANRSLVTKIYFPAEVFPLSSIIASFVDFVMGWFVFVGLMIYFSFTESSMIVSCAAILVIPVFFTQVLFTVGMSFFLSMGNLFFRDVRYIYGVVITLWMFASSVVYPMKVSNHRLQMILNFNPMTPILDAYRDVLLRGKFPDIDNFAYATIISIILFLIGWMMFYKMQYKFAEKV
jgi:lipopolysaccharide transport system permease protein